MIASKIVHIHFKNTDTHEYYSSIKAAYQHHDSADIGLQYRSLVNALHGSGFYQNKRIIARIGKIESAKQNNKTK